MKRLSMIALFVILLALPIAADTIHFKDGRVLKGKIIKETDKEVTIKLKYGEMTYQKTEIDRIERNESDGLEEPDKPEKPEKSEKPEPPSPPAPPKKKKAQVSGQANIIVSGLKYVIKGNDPNSAKVYTTSGELCDDDLIATKAIFAYYVQKMIMKDVYKNPDKYKYISTLPDNPSLKRDYAHHANYFWGSVMKKPLPIIHYLLKDTFAGNHRSSACELLADMKVSGTCHNAYVSFQIPYSACRDIATETFKKGTEASREIIELAAKVYAGNHALSYPEAEEYLQDIYNRKLCRIGDELGAEIHQKERWKIKKEVGQATVERLEENAKTMTRIMLVRKLFEAMNDPKNGFAQYKPYKDFLEKLNELSLEYIKKHEMVMSKAESAGKRHAKRGEENRRFFNSIGQRFVLIPAGEFKMGDGIEKDNVIHDVKITKAFYMQTTEVTQAQWEAVMGNNPSQYKGEDFPVESVNWNDAQEFIKKLNDKEKSKGKTYGLPTEAEWEYACRAGSDTRFHFGDDEELLKEYVWYCPNSDGRLHSVGLKKPNKWGLFNMHGSVSEWCQDYLGFDYYLNSPKEDPKGPEKTRHPFLPGEFRIIRGGTFSSDPYELTSGRRGCSRPDSKGEIFGFRLVCNSQ
ncbi:MAG: formylglycine-generating enzyme family protein [Planctomycetota bacterium]|jgi:formylglycine-generating enzyme required for sulfatase activity